MSQHQRMRTSIAHMSDHCSTPWLGVTSLVNMVSDEMQAAVKPYLKKGSIWDGAARDWVKKEQSEFTKWYPSMNPYSPLLVCDDASHLPSTMARLALSKLKAPSTVSELVGLRLLSFNYLHDGKYHSLRIFVL